MVRLVFNNAEATPKTEVIECDRASVPSIMAWYGAYFAGDRYTVAMDGRNVAMDINGEPVGELPCPPSRHTAGSPIPLDGATRTEPGFDGRPDPLAAPAPDTVAGAAQ